MLCSLFVSSRPSAVRRNQEDGAETELNQKDFTDDGGVVSAFEQEIACDWLILSTVT